MNSSVMPLLETQSDYSPAFILGVTGHMDLDPAFRPNVETMVRRAIDWLRSAAQTKDPILGPGLGLVKTPILLFSSLAPGADQWVAIVAQEMGVRVLAPLPFLKDQYLRSSTFQKDGRVINEEATRFFTHFPDESRGSSDGTFLVRLLDEIDLDDEELRRKHEPLLTGPEHKHARDQRFAAAGEYVAAYSDILLALTNKPIGQPETTAIRPGVTPGARAIAEMKRRGLSPGFLPVQPALDWADNGPVIHILARRSSDPPADAASAESSAGMEILYPYDLLKNKLDEREDRNPTWQVAGRELLQRTTQHLERFNDEAAPRDDAVEKAELAKAFRDMDGLLSRAEKDLPPAERPRHHREFRKNLDRIAGVRRRAAQYNAHYDGKSKSHRLLLFQLAFCSACFFALADSWQVENDRLWWLRSVFFAVALLATLTAWFVYFWYVRRSEAARHGEDYRAIAEGLRVQFYWTAGGSGESVASSYLQRQRGELGWTRNVISSVSFPYEENRMYFSRLSSEAQREALQRIRERWLGVQLKFFKDNVKKIARAKSRCSEASKVLLWTSFILAALLFFSQWTKTPALPTAWAWCSVVAAGLLAGLSWLVGWRDSRSSHGGALVMRREGPGPFVSFLQAGALSTLSVGVASLLGGIAWWMPDADKLGAMLKTIDLTAGALCVAWINVSFYTENIHRYTSMISLFEGASQRLGELLQSVELASDEDKSVAHRRAVRHAQEMLVAVGKEALSENAEWLIAHRTRPLEPVTT